MVKECTACKAINPAYAILCMTCGASVVHVRPERQPDGDGGGGDAAPPLLATRSGVGPGARAELPASPAPGRRSGPATSGGDRHVAAVLCFPWGEEAVAQPLQIGREPGFSPLADRLAAYAGLSRKHATVWAENGKLLIVDHGSANTTETNGKPLRPHESVELRDGDVVSLARAVSFSVAITTRRMQAQAG